jgi:Bifunctional DNA primase/polymerase, N-terminal
VRVLPGPGRVAAALAAAARGLALFPLPPGGRIPAPGWQRQCTSDPVAVAAMAAAGNVGVGCRASGIVALDLDRHGDVDGLAVLAALCARAGRPWPSTLAVATPRDGLHLYFRAGSAPVPSGRRWPGIDVRAPGYRTGGYLVGPGSIVPAGAYALVHDVPVAPLPAWLAGPLTRSATTQLICPASPCPPDREGINRSPVHTSLGVHRQGLQRSKNAAASQFPGQANAVGVPASAGAPIGKRQAPASAPPITRDR